jgi:deazaflavin-dependent oxidoreductase (nitroreductase family)
MTGQAPGASPDEPGAPYTWDRERFEEYEGSGGTSGTQIDGKAVVILTTFDAATGKIRKSPLMRVSHGNQYAVIGSRGGAAEHPQWYHDILARPMVELQDGPLKAVYRAREATGADREIWWRRAVEAWPAYAADQQKTSRRIPVVVLTPEA